MDDFETLHLAATIKDDLGKTRQAVEYARRANSIRMVSGKDQASSGTCHEGQQHQNGRWETPRSQWSMPKEPTASEW